MRFLYVAGVRLLKNDRGGVRAQVRRLFLQFENNAPVSDDAGNPVYNTGHCLNLSLLELQVSDRKIFL